MTDILGPVNVAQREGASIEISRHLLDYLLSGRIQPGDRLPPERKLADALGVGRSVVREALKSLTLLGLLEARLGDGTYVKRVDAEILPTSIEWGLVLGARRVLDLVEARGHLDIVLAGLAATRRDDRDITDLRGLVKAMEATRRDPPRFPASQSAFLAALAEVAGNVVVAGAASTIRSLLQVWVARVQYTARDVEEAATEFGAVVDAVEAADSVGARAAMAVANARMTQQISQTIGDDNRGEKPALGS